MGLLDSYMRLKDMARKSEARSDVAGDLASMQSKLNGLNASMTAQNAAAAVAADPASQARRVDAIATVNSSRLTGTQINDGSMIELGLTVMLAGGIPVPVSHTTIVPSLQLQRVQVGGRLAVSLDPTNTATLSIDWARAAA